MAEGGTCTIDMESAQNFEEQQDELTALESIYGDTNRFKIVSRRSGDEQHDEKENAIAEQTREQDLFSVHIAVDVAFEDGVLVDVYVPCFEDSGESSETVGSNLSASNRPQFNRSQSGHSWTTSLELRYLTSINLHVTFPVTYPTDTAPMFQLTCHWLDGSKLSALCQELDRIWDENIGNPILFSWIDWLENDAVDFLGMKKTVCIGPYMGVCEDFQDTRAVPICGDIEDVVVKLLEHNYRKEMEDFRQSYQTCHVCFDERLGVEFIRLDECGHHYCNECMTDYCQMHVKDGTVQNLLCPDTECETLLPPSAMRAVLREEEYQRWERLSLQKTLNVMQDVEWCPRCNMPVVHEDESSTQAHCTYCTYTFCSQCRNAYHLGSECPTEGEKLVTKAKKANTRAEQERLRKLAADFALSEYQLKNLSKPCPSCKAPIEKTEGCNKVTCTQCTKAMCWLCVRKIDGYEHFRTGKCDLFTVAGHVAVIRQPRQEENPEAARIRYQLRANPQFRAELAVCPNCKQRVQKEGGNNHLKCYNCKTNFCFQCKTTIKGNVSEHYRGATKCAQHS